MSKPGHWKSPLSPEAAAAASVRYAGLEADGGAAYFIEDRPSEDRSVIVRWRDGSAVDVLPPPFSAKSKVNEYGGGSFTVHEGMIVFVDKETQAPFILEEGGIPRPLMGGQDGVRWANPAISPDGQLLAIVKDDHDIQSLQIASIDDPSLEWSFSAGDFVASPAWSPDPRKLTCLTWSLPNMPWDESEVWEIELLGSDAQSLSLDAQSAGGGNGISSFQPSYSPSGVLHYVADPSGWWNLHRWDGESATNLTPDEAEYGVPQWVFGCSTYDFAEDGTLWAMRTKDGSDYLVSISPDGDMAVRDLGDFSSDPESHLRYSEGSLFGIGGWPDRGPAPVRFDLAAGGVPVSLSELPPALGPEFISRAEPFRFQGPWTHPIYGYFFAPANPEGSEGPPPLVVRVHGGPTGRNSAIYDPEVHFFTTRGFGVLAVDHRGSSGYGREFREAIFGRWGKADVEDCIAAAKHFAEAGRVDGARMFIRGRSAGGMTTLMALVGETVFRGGVDMFGVVDPKSLALVAPRFESTYDEALMGDLDEETYLARTPTGSAKNIRVPVLILQGNEDAIVPPTQSELIVEKLRAAGVTHAYEVFEGEGHGFRKAASIVRALELELAFYQDLLV